MVASEMLAQLNSVLAARGVVVESIPLRTITLPDRLVAAIEDKLRMEQVSQNQVTPPSPLLPRGATYARASDSRVTA